MVMAHASLSGSWSQVEWESVIEQERRKEQMGTEPSGRVGPEYVSYTTVTATGRSGGPPPGG